MKFHYLLVFFILLMKMYVVSPNTKINVEEKHTENSKSDLDTNTAAMQRIEKREANITKSDSKLSLMAILGPARSTNAAPDTVSPTDLLLLFLLIDLIPLIYLTKLIVQWHQEKNKIQHKNDDNTEIHHLEDQGDNQFQNDLNDSEKELDETEKELEMMLTKLMRRTSHSRYKFDSHILGLDFGDVGDNDNELRELQGEFNDPDNELRDHDDVLSNHLII